MLAFVATDAPIGGSAARDARARNRRRVVQLRDRRRRHVDQRQLRASPPPARRPMAPIERADDPRLAPIRAALTEVATALAQAIVRDGEGATKFITIAVEGGRDAAECRAIAFGIAHSPLVKTAFFASDPNLGRIVCAIGNAAARDLDPGGVSFWLDDVLVVDRRRPRAVVPRGGRAARDEAGRDHRPRRARPRAAPARRCGPAIFRTITSASTPTTGARCERLPARFREVPKAFLVGVFFLRQIKTLECRRVPRWSRTDFHCVPP